MLHINCEIRGRTLTFWYDIMHYKKFDQYFVKLNPQGRQ
ncbi:hypothetical protein Desor_2505 [Desulfosporosinus orientis DSM 765]|uniref:Uncharacterized protein n=1 Tax=Desulfosporosinus orientis (strain ATCC 19365 / DSM 765 / NCIMB 8382 / VKM B-1628 / Singapore I) TaxID=768706 RepID=G7WGI7_DESOD|nr:hypothetical protein Desor_2505 [Desulfosporosinus orientis DSM 765]